MPASATPLTVAVLFGGKSAEHDISLRSARAIVDHLDRERYRIRLVGITREGGFLSEEASARLLAGEDAAEAGGAPSLPQDTDVVFPVLHGPGGEDGTLQGWLELLDIPFVGSSCTGSALAMDKSLAKHVLRSADVPVLPWVEVRRACFEADPEACLANVLRERPVPLFVKPTCLGSSVGISMVSKEEDLGPALAEAFRFGEEVIVEPAIDARELEVAVLDGSPLQSSEPGEIRIEGWYDYDNKYLNDDAELFVPAQDLPQRMADAMREFAQIAFRSLRLAGLARIDFLLDRKAGRFYLNEVNTMPGFTTISMYPKLMEASGIPFEELCHRLIALAMERGGRPAKPKAPAQTSERLLEAEHGTA